MISLKSAFKHSFHDNGNMYKRHDSKHEEEKMSVNRRRGHRSARRAACGGIGFPVIGSFGPLPWRLTRLDVLKESLPIMASYAESPQKGDR